MKQKITLLFLITGSLFRSYSQAVTLSDQIFELRNVSGSLTELNNEKVLKIESDLKKLPFDINNLGSTVDEPTYARLLNLDFEEGTIEVKMLSRIQDPSPFPSAQGFIGVAFRISDNDSAYESVYLRPKVGRSDNQLFRNKTVQYYAYPDYKFDKLKERS